MLKSVPAVSCQECCAILPLGSFSSCPCGLLEVGYGRGAMRILSFRGKAPIFLSIEIEEIEQ